MREKIVIRNIGPLKDIEIEEIKSLTVIIGPSSSGKSALMKLIALFRYIYKMVNIRSYLKNSKISRSPFRLHFKKLIETNGLVDMFSTDSYVRYETSFENGLTYTIEYTKGKLSSNFTIDNSVLTFSKETFICESRNIIPNWMARPVSNRKSSLGFYFHETLGDFEIATEKEGKVELEHIGMDLEIKKVRGLRKFLITPTDGRHHSITLNTASSGVQTSMSIPVIMRHFAKEFSFKDAFQRSVISYLFEGDRLLSYKPSIEFNNISKIIHVHVEEPELSLDPTAQRKLLNQMVEYVELARKEDRDMNVMIATHSPYILNQLNLLFKAFDTKSLESIAGFNYDETSAFLLEDGQIEDLKLVNARLVNTNRLSEDINEIYNTYDIL